MYQLEVEADEMWSFVQKKAGSKYDRNRKLG
jgi:hypothetical protein